MKVHEDLQSITYGQRCVRRFVLVLKSKTTTVGASFANQRFATRSFCVRMQIKDLHALQIFLQIFDLYLHALQIFDLHTIRCKYKSSYKSLPVLCTLCKSLFTVGACKSKICNASTNLLTNLCP